MSTSLIGGLVDELVGQLEAAELAWTKRLDDEVVWNICAARITARRIQEELKLSCGGED